jgi:hypothetical protein
MRYERKPFRSTFLSASALVFLQNFFLVFSEGNGGSVVSEKVNIKRHEKYLRSDRFTQKHDAALSAKQGLKASIFRAKM